MKEKSEIFSVGLNGLAGILLDVIVELALDKLLDVLAMLLCSFVDLVCELWRERGERDVRLLHVCARLPYIGVFAHKLVVDFLADRLKCLVHLNVQPVEGFLIDVGGV